GPLLAFEIIRPGLSHEHSPLGRPARAVVGGVGPFRLFSFFRAAAEGGDTTHELDIPPSSLPAIRLSRLPARRRSVTSAGGAAPMPSPCPCPGADDDRDLVGQTHDVPLRAQEAGRGNCSRYSW